MFNAVNFSDTSPDQPPSKNQKLSEDLKEFDFVACDEGALTSNVAILAAEFSVAQDEVNTAGLKSIAEKRYIKYKKNTLPS